MSYSLEHHDCPETKTIRIPTYPGSPKMFSMPVCDECEGEYLETSHSSAESFFQGAKA